jgi:hypothetical protein
MAQLQTKAQQVVARSVEESIALTAETDEIALLVEERPVTITQQPQGAPGPRGEKGDTGPNNLFIQQTQPVTDQPRYMWWELNPDNTLRTLWIETGA